MIKKRLVLQLTDFTVHARDFRPATKFANTIKNKTSDGKPLGRMYSPEGIEMTEDGKFKFRLQLPPDLMEQVKRGEIELAFALPKSGLPFLLGKDAEEKIDQLKRKDRTQLIRSGKVWREK